MHFRRRLAFGLVALILAACTSAPMGDSPSGQGALGSKRDAVAPSGGEGTESPGGTRGDSGLKPISEVTAPVRRERLRPISRTKPRSVLASWVVRSTLWSDTACEKIVEEAVAGGLNTLLVQVRGRGDAWYQTELEPRPPQFQGKDFDPLDSMLEHALHAGLYVHAWFNVNLVAGANALPTDPRHVAISHPEWLAYPETLASELLKLPPQDQRIAERLRAHAAGRPNDVEGLYADPSNPEYRAHVARLCRELVQRYPLDGIHLDYIRYAGTDAGYSRHALSMFQKEVFPSLDKKERQEIAKRLPSEPTLLTKRYAGRWADWKRNAVTGMVAAISDAVRSVRSDIVVSAAVFADLKEARTSVSQDWPLWLERRIVDVVCPMAYTTQRGRFEEQLKIAAKERRSGKVWAGIGSWQLKPEETVDRVKRARTSGMDGVVLFSHGDLQKRPETLRLLKSL